MQRSRAHSRLASTRPRPLLAPNNGEGYQVTANRLRRFTNKFERTSISSNRYYRFPERLSN
jgi:hypothetical protein